MNDNTKTPNDLFYGQLPIRWVITESNIQKPWLNSIRDYMNGLGAESSKTALYYFLLIIVLFITTIFFSLIEANVINIPSIAWLTEFIEGMAGNYAAEFLSILVTIVIIERLINWREESRKKDINESTLELLTDQLRSFALRLVSGLYLNIGKDPERYFGTDVYSFLIESTSRDSSDIKESNYCSLLLVHLVTEKDADDDRKKISYWLNELSVSLNQLEERRASITGINLSEHLFQISRKVRELNRILYFHDVELNEKDSTTENMPFAFHRAHRVFVELLEMSLASELMLTAISGDTTRRCSRRF